jgi:hypothetical protein
LQQKIVFASTQPSEIALCCVSGALYLTPARCLKGRL